MTIIGVILLGFVLLFLLGVLFNCIRENAELNRIGTIRVENQQDIGRRLRNTQP